MLVITENKEESSKIMFRIGAIRGEFHSSNGEFGLCVEGSRCQSSLEPLFSGAYDFLLFLKRNSHLLCVGSETRW